MDEVELETVADPDLVDPVLVEGLPGVGLVGKLVVDHLLSECPDQPVRRIYSEHLPPAIGVAEDGTAMLAHLTVSAVETDSRDLLVLAGDSQAPESLGQYRLAAGVLDLVAEFDIEEIVTLGGFGTGEPVDDYSVLGAAPEGAEAIRERFAAAGVEFGRSDTSSIVGMSGLLVGLGGRRGLQTAGLLGLTSGYHVDPASARAVIEALQHAYDFTVDLETLEEQAAEVQAILDQLQSQAEQDQAVSQGGENLRYFG